MAQGGRIDYTVGFTLDKSGLNEAVQALTKLQSISSVDIMKSTGFKEGSLELKQAVANMEAAKKAAAAIGPALQKSFNTKLNTVSVKTFEQEINKTYGSVTSLFNALNRGGLEAQQIAGKLSNSLLSTNIVLQKSKTLIDKMGESLVRTLGWSLSSSVVNRATGAIQQAVGYIEHLDSSLNDIRIVTKKSADEMNNFAIKANDAAKALGRSTTQYTEASLIYYQQGLSDEEVAARTETTLKVANVTGQSTQAVSEELTAVWNGYKVNAEEAELYVDKLSAVAATTASDLQELSTGMSKVASAANSMGVDVDQLNAQLATIISVTRQAPESVGTALKTIYARMTDLTMGGEDEEGVDLGKVSGGLANAGINILDETGDLRDLGEVIEEVAEHWENWTSAQQAAIAQLLAGKRQYNNLVALFDNWDMYESAIDTSRNSVGELQKQQDIYMDSTEAHLRILSTQWEDLYDSLLNSKTINTFADAMTTFAKALTDVVDALGGGGGVLASLVSIFSGTLSNKLAGGISNMLGRASDNAAIKEELDARMRIAQELQKTEGASKAIGEYYAKWGQYAKDMTSEEIAHNMALSKEIGDLATKRDLLLQNESSAKEELTATQLEQIEIKANIKALEEQKIKNKEIIDEQEQQREEAHEKELKRIEEEYQARLKAIQEEADRRKKEQQDKLEADKTDAAKGIKRIEAALGEQQAYTQKNGATFARTKDLSQKYSEEDIKTLWNQNSPEIDVFKEDLTKVQSQNNIVIKDLKASISGFSDDFKTVTDENWIKWEEKAGKAIKAAQGHLKMMFEDDEYVKAFNEKIESIFTKDGKINKGFSDKAAIILKELVPLEEEFKKRLAEMEKILGTKEENNKEEKDKTQEKAEEKAEKEKDEKIKQKNIEFDKQEKEIKKEVDATEEEITNELKEQNKLKEESEEKEKQLKSSLEDNKNQRKSITEAIEAQNQAMDEQMKKQSRKNTIEGILNIGGALTGIANMNTQLENLGKNLIASKTNLAGFAGSLSAIITSGVSGFNNLSKMAQNFSGNQIKAISAFGGVLSKINPALMGISVLTGVFNLIKGAIQGAREAAAELNAELAENKQKLAENAQQELDEVTKLKDSYNQILEVRDENGVLSREQQDQIYKLVEAYGDEELMLLALAGDYDTLAEKMKGIEKAKEEAFNAAAENAMMADEQAFVSQINADHSSDATDKGLVLDRGHVSESQLERDLEKALGTTEQVLEDGVISWNNLLKLMTVDQKKYNEFLKEYQDTDIYNQLLEIQNENSNTLNDYTQKFKSTNDYRKGNIVDNVLDGKEIKTAEQYKALQNEVISKFQEEGLIGNTEEAKQEGIKWISSYLEGTVEGAQSFSQANVVADSIQFQIRDETKLNEDVDKIGTEIMNRWNNLSASQQQFIASNTTAIAALLEDGMTVEEIFNNLNHSLQELTSKDHRVEIDTIISGTSKKKIQEAIDTLFADSTFDIGISKEQFMLLDSATQKQILIAKQIEEEYANQEVSESQQAALEELNKRIDQRLADLRKEADELDQKYGDNSDSKEQAINAAQSWKESMTDGSMEFSADVLWSDSAIDRENAIEDITGDFEKLQDIMLLCQEEGMNFSDALLQTKGMSTELDESFNNLSESTLDYLTYIFQSTDAEKDQAKIMAILQNSIQGVSKESKEGKKELENITKEIESLTGLKINEIDITPDFKSDLTNIKNTIAETSKAIDDLQNTYASLNTIVEDYNEDGYLSMDNLQQLMKMDDSYVASLELVNGQLQLNDETLQAITQNKLHAMEVEATDLYLKELEAIANHEVVTSSAQLDAANEANVATIEAVAGAAADGVDALLKFAAAKRAAEVDLSQTQEVTQAYYNRMQMIKNLASQPLSSALKKDSKSKGSTKQPKEEKHLEREEDIYRQINAELKQIESTLGRIQKLEDHSWGASAKANLEEENKLLEKQLEKLHEKKALQERDLSSRRGQLEGMGFSFSGDGSAITNADTQLNALYAHYNTMVDTYNGLSVAEQETYKKQLDAEKDRIKKIEDKIKDYESTFSDYQSVLDEIMDKHFEQIEKQVQAFNHDIELHLELDEAKEEWNDFWYDIVKDVEDTDFGGQIAKSIDKLKLLVGGFGADVSKSTIAQLTGHLNETITQVRAQIASASRGGADSMFGDDTALSKETLENYMKALMDKLKEAKAEVDNIGENYLKTLDSAQEKIDKQVEAFESINSHLEHNAKLIQMLSGENSFEALNNMYDQQYDNNIRLVETQRANKEFWEQQIASEKAMMESAEKGSKDYKIHAEALKKASENYSKAINDFDSSIEKTIEDLNKWKDNQLAAINDTFDKALSNGYGLDMVEKEWKLINDQANRYLDNVERALGMESLNNEFNKVLNTTNMSIKAQQELNQMRDEEIAKLNKKVQISQFDLDEVKARLEIRKQEIALEDAQRNKSNLRLRRDSQGNYSYQYTGDDSQIEEASEGLMSAKQAWYDLVKKRNIELADAVLENRKNLQKELQDLESMYFESDEEKRKKQLEIIQRYEDIEKDIMKDAEDAKRIFFDGTAKFFEDVENASILPQWDSTIEKMISSWSSGGKESFTGAVTAGIEQIDSVQTEYVRRTNELLDKAGVDYQNLKNNGIDPTTNSLEEMTSSNEELADSLEEVNRLLEENADKLKEAEECYNDLKDAAVEAGREAERTLEQLAQTAIRTQQQVQASIQATRDMSNSWPQESSNSSRNSIDGTGTTLSGTGNTTQKSGYTVTYTDSSGGHSYSQNYSDKSSAKSFAASRLATGSKHVTILDEKTKRRAQGNYSQIETAQDAPSSVREQLAKKIFESFRSGGYTGSWNDLSSGKLAILHQKELVLNESDTSNILKAVEMLRTIAVDKIADSILNAAKASANILANVNTGAAQSMANLITNETDNSYRNMTVNADFSGVRSADAIYEALRNLENVSMQGSF